MPEHLIRLLNSAYAAPADGASDAELLARVAAGPDEVAFELLVRRHAGLVWRVCTAVARDYHAAEDAFQAAFLALARKARSVRKQASVGGWLQRVAYHAALKARPRASTRPAALTADVPDTAAGPVETLAKFELSRVIVAELDRLPDRYRIPVVLCHLEGLTQVEAARRLGMPVGTLSSRVRRGLDRLRDRLSHRGIAPAVAGISGGLVGSATAAPETIVRVVVRLAATFPVGCPPVIVQLVNGALSAMTYSKPKILTGVLVGFAAVACGLSVAGGQVAAPAGSKDNDPPARSAAAPPPPLENPKPVKVGRISTKAQRDHSLNNLRRILEAINNYHGSLGTWPTGIQDDQNQVILSWRVQILPYLDQHALSERFKLDEPWDSEHNRKLLAEMPDVYKVGIEPPAAIETYYQGFTGPDTVFDLRRNVTFNAVTDGTSNTLGVVEAGPPVPWTKPADLPYSSKKPLPKLVGPFDDVFHVAMCDRSAYPFRWDIDPQTLRAYVTRSGGEVPDAIETLLVKSLPPTLEERRRAEKLLTEINELRSEAVRLDAESQKLFIENYRLLNEAAKVKGELDLTRLESDKRMFSAEVVRLKENFVRLKGENEKLRAAAAAAKK
ncbi:sigma-70 family RNA polymerase sigma factor [Fimbriiglobus ruber]|uniref:RNA polymerase sigma factor RpoE n=1 Tax=Fimbriiglobus ruber TaxID=1908690 RepID=A0A225E0M9_9BACT|nr:sigma-70 family RNA polymerase sigma factor [Fimbriiglobus ruber]OWK47290.1 hypothetical protein FRUB_00989 [Fimbriiglobus ruber]